MTIAALVDLGVPFEVVRDAVGALGLDCEIAVSRARSGALGASHFSVTPGANQPERRYRDVRALVERAPLAAGTHALALRIFERLAHAEAAVHRVPLEDVTFHEVGSVDSLADVVGAAACLDYLGAQVVGSPVPLGRGSVRTAHGRLPLPAPATLECLAGVPTVESDLDFELVTPTGAAILATVAERFERWPAVVPERTGWGAGTRAFADRPNALRVVLGAATSVDRTSDLFVLEANVDDMTGELAGHVISLLLDAGALDAWAVPATMKKGRPGLLLSALSREAFADELSRLMLRETTSIGVRRLSAARVERPRRTVEVETRFGTIPVKVSEGPYGPPQAKPEFDACARAANTAGVPVREVIAEALAVWSRSS
jgi:pyridinium-3,5-bisthiocarboxylic acid mononucleotide nickel chelatase